MSTSVTGVKAADFPLIVSSSKELGTAVENVKTAFNRYEQSHAAHEGSDLNAKVETFYKEFKERIKGIRLDDPIESCLVSIFQETPALGERIISGRLEDLAQTFARGFSLAKFLDEKHTVAATIQGLDGRVQQVKTTVPSLDPSKVDTVFYDKMRAYVQYVKDRLPALPRGDIQAQRKRAKDLEKLNALIDRLSGSATVLQTVSDVAQALTPEVVQGVYGDAMDLWVRAKGAFSEWKKGSGGVWQTMKGLSSSPKAQFGMYYLGFSLICYMASAVSGVQLNPIFTIPGAVVANVISWVASKGLLLTVDLAFITLWYGLGFAINLLWGATYYSAFGVLSVGSALLTGDMSVLGSCISSLLDSLVVGKIINPLSSLVYGIATTLLTDLSSLTTLFFLAWKAGLIPDKGRILGYIDRWARRPQLQAP